MEFLSIKTSTDLFFIVFLLLFSLTALSGLTFAQFTMRRLEKEFRKKDVSYRAMDFGGSRIVTYAYVMLLPEHIAQRLSPLIDSTLVRSSTTKIDWWRSLFFVVSSHLWICVGIIGGIFFIDT